MPLINPDAQVAALAAEFMIITAPALLFTQLIVIYEGALRAQGKPACRCWPPWCPSSPIAPLTMG